MAVYQPPYYGQYGGYTPMMPQPLQVPQPVPQTANTASTGLIWVQGEAGAKSYLVAPGNTLALWDSENQVIYLKSSDQSGMPSMRVLDYTERTQGMRPNPMSQPTDYIRRDEFDKLKAIVEQMKGGADDGKPAI